MDAHPHSDGVLVPREVLARMYKLLHLLEKTGEKVASQPPTWKRMPRISLWNKPSSSTKAPAKSSLCEVCLSEICEGDVLYNLDCCGISPHLDCVHRILEGGSCLKASCALCRKEFTEQVKEDVKILAEKDAEIGLSSAIGQRWLEKWEKPKMQTITIPLAPVEEKEYLIQKLQFAEKVWLRVRSTVSMK
eukprot:1365309-Amorphochlora_amoeboformis.AAC.2